MKKLKIIALALLFMLPCVFVGCKNNKDTLSTPTIIEIDNGSIVFSPVMNADYYTLMIDDLEIAIDANNNKYVQLVNNNVVYDASKIFVAGNSYSVKIQANSQKRTDSKFSNAISYTYNGKIEKPENVKINSTILTWDSVENASYYIVKMITPNDEIVFDKYNEVLDKDDPESILNADLTEYRFNTNQFDFSSLLTTAGTYKFYVSSVISNGINYVQSSFTTKQTYVHNILLSNPTNSEVYRVDGELFLRTIIDPKANQIRVTCNGIEKTTELQFNNTTTSSLTKINSNVIDINLNEYFKTFIDAQQLDFNEAKQFTFTTQCLNTDSSYYTNSQPSQSVHYNNTKTLATPTLSVEFDEQKNAYILSWESEEISLLSKIKIYLATPTSVEEYELNSNVPTMILPDNFLAVAIQALGSGNYLNSNISSFVERANLENSLKNLTLNVSNSGLAWSNLGADYYIVSFDGLIYTTTNNYFNFAQNVKLKEYEFRVVAIKDGYKISQDSLSASVSKKLATPTFSASQGFNSKNIYELTFTGTADAIGYYVYIKTSNDNKYLRLDTLYTTTKIDLTQYIISEENYQEYSVKVQAVGFPGTNIVDSELSEEVKVSHVKVLDTPEFNKTGSILQPVVKENVGDSTKYNLKFKGVEYAAYYEIFINYNRILLPATAGHLETYECDITDYLKTANNYEIKIRALPNDLAFNMQASEFNVTNYILTKQLDTVQNVQIGENDGIYILSFDLVNNASSYRVRIVKENDGSYGDYLETLGLTHIFETDHAVDVTQYVKQQGIYYFYVTAIASTESGNYYSNANESNYAVVDKLTSLNSPTELLLTDNVNNTEYWLNWTGDEHADYYLIKVDCANGNSFELTSIEPHIDLQKCMTIQGDYTFTVYSCISALSENSKEYTSSEGASLSHVYTYEKRQDFLRYSITMFDESNNFIVNDVQDLKNLLWHNYLFELNDYGLTFMLPQIEKEDNTGNEVLRDSIMRLANESTKNNLYDFHEGNSESEWEIMLNSSADIDLLQYLCSKLLSIYPEFNILEWDSSTSVTIEENIITLKYKNALNGRKIEDNYHTVITNTNYGNKQQYIEVEARKSETGVFKIDTREEMLVTTTEQLIYAVQNNKKPKFVGDCAVAEEVYNNAKLVLTTIVSNNMTDLEKTTAIFNWISNNFDLTYYSIEQVTRISGAVENGDMSKFGIYKQYYLEGIFEGISMDGNGNLIIPNHIATSFSYSKAFALLCNIEGIEAIVVNGNYSASIHDVNTQVKHAWNKVKISTTSNPNEKAWFVVDITFSDNKITFNSLDYGYGVSSHTHFLTPEDASNDKLHLTSYSDFLLSVEDLSYKISNTYSTNRSCSTSYNCYTNMSFGLTTSQIIENFEGLLLYQNGTPSTTGFKYSLEYKQLFNYYQKYNGTQGYGELQDYIFNTIVYTQFMAIQNGTNKSMFEFNIDYATHNGSVADLTSLQDFNNVWVDITNTFVNRGLKVKKIDTFSIKKLNTSTSTLVFVVEYQP